MSFIVHNDGGAPAMSAVVTVEDANDGRMLGESAAQRIEPTGFENLSVALPREEFEADTSTNLRSGLIVRVVDRNTGEQDSYVT